MPTTRFVDSRFAKHFVIACCATPFVLLLWDAYHHQLGVNAVNYAIRSTGLVGIIFLTLSLAMTPLRRLTNWNPLIAVRRNFGVFGFFYIAMHFTIFFVWDRDMSVGSTLHEIVTRQYLWFGTGALVLMIPLALTSFDSMVSRLGGKRWKQLHRLNYVIVGFGVIHYYLLVKADTTIPKVFAVAFAILMLTRLIPTKKRAGSTKKRAFWSGELAIAKITDETHNVKTFRFVSPDGGPLPFEHIAGQYINLKLMIDGKRVNRSYTIASPPTRNTYCEISVKKASYASKFLHEEWREGHRIKVSAPAGKFYFAGHESNRIVLIAGGIGITPMMSVIRSLTDRNWSGEMYLLFSVREDKDIVFKSELADLQAKHRNLRVQYVVTSRDGQINAETIKSFVPGIDCGPVMLCGPDPMMTAMRKLLVEIGIPDGEIHQEAFISPASTGSEDVEEVPEGTRTIEFKRADKRIQITNGLTVLEAAEDAGVSIPYECRSGICGQCKTRLLTGRVAMEVQDALTPAEKSKGLILACQAQPVNDISLDV